MPLPLLVGLILGLAMGVGSGYRAATGRNTRLPRNPDGSIHGGTNRVAFGVGVMWFVIGAVVTWLLSLVF